MPAGEPSSPEAWQRALKPLEFAAQRNFSNLGVVKGLEAAVVRGLSACQDPAADPGRKAFVLEQLAGLDSLELPEKKQRIQVVLNRAGGGTAIVSKPSRPSPAAPRTNSSPAPRPPSRSAPSSERKAAPARGKSTASRSRGGGSQLRLDGSEEGPQIVVGKEGPSVNPKHLAQAAPKAKVQKPKQKRIRMNQAEPGTPLELVIGVGPKTAEKLAAKGLQTVQDALFFVPIRYEDRSAFTPINELMAGTRVTVKGEISAMALRYAGRKRVYEIAVSDGTGTVSCRLFRFSQKQLEARHRRGQEVILSGPVSQWGAMRQLVHPDIQIVKEGETGTPEGILPIYSEIDGVPTRKLRTILAELSTHCAHKVIDPLPEAIRKRHSLPGLAAAVAGAHHPEDFEDEPLALMRSRLVFDEMLAFQLALAFTRKDRKSAPGLVHAPQEDWDSLAKRMLPFELTKAQKRVSKEIYQDLISSSPMNRLLQGDVGSGKTAVAMLAAALVRSSGRQSTLVAPTEILAEQHARSAEKFLAPLGMQVALLTGSTTTKARRMLLRALERGDVDLLIGTHAVMEPDVLFKDLGLCIVDEQHRFGVAQRAALRNKRDDVAPDVLVMTATPIPRTLAMTLYGDLHVSVIDELPPGRTPIDTRVYPAAAVDSAYDRVEEQLSQGRQAYVVFPLVETSDKLELKDATEAAERLAKRFPNYHVALLHGRMKPQEKQEVMNAFSRNEVQVLVSTTVIEVGVDVPNSTVMVVEEADRFGLSQLHQLRGRVGRGQWAGHCLLVGSKGIGVVAKQRLQVMASTTDGFKVAQHDLEARGPGELLGTKQSGLPELLLTDIAHDGMVIEAAREEAEMLAEIDPELKKPEHAALREELLRRFEGRFGLAEIA